MSEDLVIRIGNPSDVHDMMALAMMGSEENGFLEVTPEKMLQDIWCALNLDRGLMGIIGAPGGKPEGAILMRIGSLFYSDQNVLEEKAIFIHPDFRAAKGGRASRLCEFSKKMADSLGLPLIIGVLSNNRTEAKIRLYERHFGKPAGAFFLYGAKTGEWKKAVGAE